MDPLALAKTAAIVGVMTIALWSDVRTRRIPNALTVTGLVVALALQALGGTTALLYGMAGAGLALLFSIPLFALGGLGGGDAKLLTVAGAFLGPKGLFLAALAAALLGVVMALAVMLRRRVFLPVLLSSRDLLLNMLTLGRAGERPSLDSPGAVKVPYGVAIAVGSLVAWFAPYLGGGT